MNFKKGKLMALTVAVLMGMSTFTSVSADEGQTGTVFKKGAIDGKPAMGLMSDFAKYNVWDLTTKTYKFTKDSQIQTNEGIFVTTKPIKIVAKNVTLEMTPVSLKGHGKHGNYGGIQINDDREYKAVEGGQLPKDDVKPGIGVDIEVGKFKINIDPTTQSKHYKSTTKTWDTYGIGCLSRAGNRINIKGDVDIHVKNTYETEKGTSFTNGIATTHQGHINIDGNVNVDVQVNQLGHEKDGFLSHYYVNGIFCGLNYTPKQYGSDINITGDANVNTNGTAIHSGGTSFITIGGGGTVEIQKETVNYSLNAEEGFISMNVKLDRLPGGRKDEMPKVVAPGTHTTKIHGNIALINREDRPANSAGLVPTIINLGLTTADSEWIGTVMDGYKENPKMKPEQKQIREQTGLNLYLMNGAKWKNEMWGTYPSTFTGSKVRSITGGESAQNAGIIYQNHFRNITVNNFSGFVRVLYERNKTKTTTIDGGDIIIKAAKEGSHLILRTSHVDGLDVKAQNETLSNLATKLQYTGEKGKLTGTVEIAEGLMEAKISKDIEFQDDGHGKYIPEADSSHESQISDLNIKKDNNGQIEGRKVDGNKSETYKNLNIDVSGSSIDEYGSEYNSVNGLYVLHGGKVDVKGNAKITVKNKKPASRGFLKGADIAHYYMSGIYAGYGGVTNDGSYDNCIVNIAGNADIDAIGVGLQANKDSFITVKGGGNIKTYALSTSATYAMLAEEGSVFMNTGDKGNAPGTSDVDIYGNLGVINKNYGIDPNPENHGSFISVGLTTENSKFTGGILNEFEENGENKYDSGIDLYLKNKAVWDNQWIGSYRPAVNNDNLSGYVLRNNPESYLYKGSKVRNLIGGESEAKAGIIYQNEDKDITVKNFSGHVKVIYKQNATNAKAFDGGAIRIKTAKEKSQITLRANINDFQMPQDREVVNYDDVLNALAGKLFYDANDGHLKGIVEFAETLDKPAYTKEISFKSDTHQGEYKPKTTPPPVQDTEVIEKVTDGYAVGREFRDGTQTTFDKDVVVNVSGKGISGKYKDAQVVTGLYILNNNKFILGKDLKVIVQNPSPATRGVTAGADVAHYYMNAIYAGYGTLDGGGSEVYVKGDVDIDVVGTGLQANRFSYITVKGGGKIKTHIIPTSETYAMLAEEGSVFMNTGDKGNEPGTSDVDIYGNLGVINKNYGINPNPGERGSFVSLGLTTENSKFTGGILNEFEENGENKHDSGIDLYLKNKAVWNNQWIGTYRVAVNNDNANHNDDDETYEQRKDPESYLYKGSKVRNLIGGESEAKAGIIYQNEDKDITVKNFSGHVKVIYKQNATNAKAFDGGAIRIKTAKENSQITLRSNIRDFKKSSGENADYDAFLNTLAGKLYYEAKDNHLTAQVEIAESLATPAYAKKISFKAVDGQGEVKPGTMLGEGGTISVQTSGESGTISGQTSGDKWASAKVLRRRAEGSTMGYWMMDAARQMNYPYNLVIDILGNGRSLDKEAKNVTGIYILDNSKVNFNKNVKITVKNADPAMRGTTPGADVVHYYMSGIYVGYGSGGDEYSQAVIKGNVDLDVVGVALQANKDGYITVKGGGKIKTYEIPTSETYAMLAEEGSVFMNTGDKGNAPGTSDVDIYGNLGVINKNYGIDPNPGNHESIVSVGLTTGKSKFTGGILNEFEENGENKHDSGVDLYLQNGATWENHWIGTHRVKATVPRKNPESYLYKGSKVRNLIGGESEAKAGIIHQNEDKDITVKNFSGHVKVIYKQNAANAKAFDGGAIRIKTAKENSQITLRSNIKDFQMPQDREVVNYDDALNALAGKLFYDANDGHLKGIVEFAETLDKPAYTKEISFKPDTHQGEYKPKTTPPPVQDTEVIEKVTDGYAVGREFRDGTQTTFDKDVVVNVSGKGISGGKNAQNVTGIYILNDSKVNFNKNLKITVKNAAPATRGTSEGADVAHYYMSGIYVGYGSGGYKYSQALIKGNVDIDVVGVGIQANKDGYIYVDGGGNITTHALTGSDTYALLSEEGLVAMNVKFDSEGYLVGAGNHDVNVYGNLGILNKNYGIDPNPGAKESYIALGLATANSKLTGAVLNEFDENGNNTNESGVDLYLQNGATWINRWIGAERVKAPREGAETYLFKGSKVHNFYGGKTEAETGFIEQEDGDRPIDIEHYNGYTVVKYAHDGKGKIQGGDIRIEEAFDGSGISIRTKSLNGLKVGTTVADDQTLINKTLAALAQKLVYQADDGKLKAKVEIAEGLATPSISKAITYFDENHHGVYDPTGVVPKKPKKFESHTQGAATGHGIYDDQKESYDDVIINVSGSGVTSEKTYNNVVGLYVLDGGQADIKGNLKVTVKNPRPALRGSSEGADIAHYYMSGVYAGYGGTTGDGDHGNSIVNVAGNVDLDVVGVALQANKDGYIKVKGGGKIKTYEIPTSETYAMLAEEGSVFMNTGDKGNAPGTSDVDIYGNLGVINKNYGIDPNPGKHESIVSVGLTTGKSKFTGGILNEFEENGENKHDSGVDLYLQNGATWENHWIGTHRVKATEERKNPESYLYKGSKVRNLIGGESEAKAGIISQNEDKDITVKNFSGHVKVIYKQNATNAKAFDGGAIRIKTAKENSQITLRSNIRDFQMPQDREVVNYDEALNALAGKLFYDANDGHLKGIVEFAETLDKPAYTKEISFKSDTHQGEYKPKTTPPVVPPVIPSEEGQTGTEFDSHSARIDGRSKMMHRRDVFDKNKVITATGEYTFTKDSHLKTKSITSADGKVTINAAGKVLTLDSRDEFGVQSYVRRSSGSTPKEPQDILINAKKIVLNIDQVASTLPARDAFGITAASNGSTVTINGDAEVHVKNKSDKGDPTGRPTFTNGIATLYHGNIKINGSVDVDVQAPGQKNMGEIAFLNHYFINGIFAGLNADDDKMGSTVYIRDNANVKTNGTAIHAGINTSVTIGGGGDVEITKHDDIAQFAMNAEGGIINMNVILDGHGDAIGAGHVRTNIKGNIGLINREDDMKKDKRLITPTAVRLGLTTEESQFKGIIHDDFKEGNAEQKEELKEVREKSGVTLYLQNGATWINETWGALIADSWNNASHKFTGSKVVHLIGGETPEKAGVIKQDDTRDITIYDYSGHVKVLYEQNATNAKAFDGGAIRIKTAKENSQITLRSNIRDFQKPSGENADYDALLNTLAGKLYYEAKDNHLTAQAEIAESLATPAYAKKISFKAADGQGEVKAGTTQGQTPGQGGTTPGQTPGQGGTTPGQTPGEGGTTPGQTPGQGGTTPGQDPNFETSVMKGIRSTMVSTGMISTGAFWSAQNNDVERRMGDIRLAQTETGLWAKYQGGSSEYNDTDSRKKAVHVDQTYNAIQVGYDKSVGDWIVGGTFSYGTTKDKYIDNRDTGKLNGTGKETGFNGGVYGTLKQKDGSYFDIIAKVGQIKNNYEVYTKDWDKDKKNDDKVNSEYKINGTSLSVEYGKRIEREGFYVEPSMELTVNRVAGHSEEVTSEVHKYKMKITQDDMTSVVGRIGVGIGQNYENGHIYGKLSLAHEFNGDIMTTFSAGNKEEVVKLSLRGTWLDVEMGGSYRLSKDSYFYGSFTKNFGAKLNNKWRLDAGIRLAF